MSNAEIPLAPVVGWDAAPIQAYGAVMLRLRYLTHPSQAMDQAHETPQFVLMAAQARELAQILLRKAEQIEAGPPEGTGLPKH